MLIVLKQVASREDIERVVNAIEELGYQGHVISGENRTAIGVTGNAGPLDPAHFENLPGVAEAIRVSKPYKLASGSIRKGNTTVKIGDAEIGGGHFTLIAGPCAVESREQAFAAAKAVAATGAKLFRGGAFKPRTSPYAFQGTGEEGLRILADIRKEFGLAIVTEAMDERGIDLVEKYGDCIQIGARNMQNFSLLKYAGKTRKPVLLKRGMSAALEELLLAAEYIMSEGNESVILCERGIRTFSDHARNTLDLSIIPAVKRVSHLPIIVDPSHGTGRNHMVGPMAKAGIAAGADGVMIEVHPQPEAALCDGTQALSIGQFTALAAELAELHNALHNSRDIMAGA